MNRFIGAIAAIVVTALIAVPARADFVFFHGGHSYLTVTTPATWAAAAGDATTRQFAGVSGALVRIDDQAENDAIIAALQANILPGDFGNTVAPDENGPFVWIGATDRQNEGEWIWDSDADGVGDQFWQACPADMFCTQPGLPVGDLYNNWFVSLNQVEPNDGFFFTTQDTAGISMMSGRWFDVAETNALYYLVEFDAVPQAAPGNHNADGKVDAADYVLWRKFPDAFGGQPGYDDWRANFGASAAVGSSVAAPEPATWLMMWVAAVLVINATSFRPAGPARARNRAGSPRGVVHSLPVRWKRSLDLACQCGLAAYEALQTGRPRVR